MKRTAFAIVAVGAFALIAVNSASASDRPASPTHADLAHRNADRQQTYQTARSLGLDHSQTDRLRSTLQHQQQDDQQAHRSATRNAPTYRTLAPTYQSARQTHGVRAQQYQPQFQSQRYYQPQYQTYAAPQNRHSSRSYRTVTPGHGNSRNYGYSRPAYNNHGLSISTRGFSLRLGH